MTFIAAAASGDRSVADLLGLLRAGLADGTITKRAHRGHVVAWTTGHPWVSSSDDGEVLVVLDGQIHQPLAERSLQAELLRIRYRQAGEDFARGVLGDFVCIVLDRTRDQLVVSRDPIGVRPWFHSSSGKQYAGATDLATVSALPWVDVSIDEAAALAYLAGEMRSSGGTLYRGVSTVAPGSTWTSAAPSARGRLHHQWNIVPEPEVSWGEALERCHHVFRQSVRDRVAVAGAATSELSGGLDSSSVIGTLVDMGYDEVLAGRLLFDGSDADERQFSDAVLEMWEIPSVSVGPWIPADDEFTALCRGLRRPPPDPNFTMTASLHRAFSGTGRSCALTGLGGDDAFLETTLGSRVVSAVQQRRLWMLPMALREEGQLARGAWRRTWRPLLAYLAGRGRPRPPRYIAERVAHEHDLSERMASAVVRVTGDRAVDERLSGLSSGYVAAIFEDAAVVHDLSGWRSTHPFFDPRFIEASYGLDPWFPVRNGHDRALEVELFGALLPPVVRDRRDKADFAEVAWARPATRKLTKRLLSGPLMQRGWIDSEAVTDVMENAMKGRAGAALPFCRLVAMHSWLSGEP
ncbi:MULTISPECIES: asparagine synthase-related protein [unclassified Blastococcus]